MNPPLHPNAYARKWELSDRKRVFEYVAEEPGSTSTDVAADLKLPLATASSQLAALWRDGKLSRVQVGRTFAYRVVGT